VKFQNEKIKRIFSKIKTWFQGEILKYKNKMIFSKKTKQVNRPLEEEGK
jgi:hypothetical protein